ELFRHRTEQARSAFGRLYRRTIYELMRYWDEDRPEYSDLEREYGEVWRARLKWVVSHEQPSLGPTRSPDPAAGIPCRLCRSQPQELHAGTESGFANLCPHWYSPTVTPVGVCVTVVSDGGTEP